MAKTRDIRNAAKVEAAPDLSTKVRNAIEAIKKPFTSFVKDFAALAISREELAPKFMKAFGMWQAETGGTFVDFVRTMDSTVGKVRAEYRAHRSYQAADYLRRIVGNAAKVNRPQTAAERASQPATPTDALARVFASLMTIIPEAAGHACVGCGQSRTALHGQAGPEVADPS